MADLQNPGALRKKIIIVEDDTFLGSLIVQKIKSAGYDVTLVSQGDQAMKVIRQEIPNLVILDLLLQNITGYDILAEMRKDDKLKIIPVIILSNLGSQKDIKKAEDLGMSAFLIKATINVNEITDHIARVLQ